MVKWRSIAILPNMLALRLSRSPPFWSLGEFTTIKGLIPSLTDTELVMTVSAKELMEFRNVNSYFPNSQEIEGYTPECKYINSF